MRIRNPEMNFEPGFRKNAGSSVSGSALNQWGFATLRWTSNPDLEKMLDPYPDPH
jgi:hypothetical protein